MNEHIVQLNATQKEELVNWLDRPNGGIYFDRVCFEAVEGGGILVRTQPYNEAGPFQKRI